MPEQAKKKLGEANLMFAMQKYDEAITLLKEVIRQAPNAADPYNTMGLVYEELGDELKALNLFMVAAHITPKQIDLWRRVASMSIKHGLIPQAEYCLGQVIRRDKEDIDARFERALLFIRLGQERKAVEGLEYVRKLKPDHAEATRQLARAYYRMGQINQAIQLLVGFWSKFPDSTDLTHVNVLAELLTIKAQELKEGWDQVLKVLEKAGKELLPNDAQLPIDLQIKEAMARINLGDQSQGISQLQTLLMCPVESHGDLYLIAATALEEVPGGDDLALPFLESLAMNPTTASLEVWYRLAENRKRQGGLEGAIAVWDSVYDSPDLRHHLQLVEAVLACAEMLEEVGQLDRAAEVLDRVKILLSGPLSAPYAATQVFQDGNEGERLVRQARVVKACGRSDLLIPMVLPSVASTLNAFIALETTTTSAPGKRNNRNGNENEDNSHNPSAAVFLGHKWDRRRRRGKGSQPSAVDEEPPTVDYGPPETGAASQPLLLQVLTERLSSIITPYQWLTASMITSLLRKDEYFRLLLVDTTRSLLDCGYAYEAKELATAAVNILGKRSPNRRKRDTMRLLMSEACIAIGEHSLAVSSLKAPAARWPSSPAVWNVLTRILLVLEIGPRTRPTFKFVSPLRQKNPDSLPLALIQGHSFLQGGMYGEAISEYSEAYALAPREPLVLFCLAIAFLNYAASKHVPDRHAAVMYAFSFLEEYGRERLDPVEVSYNAGRAAQLLSLNFLAVPLYEKALETFHDERVDSNDVEFSVAPEAAYNLAMLLRASGAHDLAREVLHKYLTF
jgi:general transcription factor 3C polypeptide 3 (transcription factor C subunit 4)